MEKQYTNEKNIQMMVSLMKQHNIRKVIISPGTTNLTLVASLQHDQYFELYSCMDEHSAGYMACGLSAETGEPVALSCTGATASRNYVSALTEAYYRKLPVLAITSTQHIGKIGQLIPQVIDRSQLQKDIVKISVDIPTINNQDDEWSNNVKINNALLELRHRGGGPVHINLATTFSGDFTVQSIPNARKINRITKNDVFPKIPKGRIAILVGAHLKFRTDELDCIDKFCEIHNAIVVCDQTSNYRGKYRAFGCLIGLQENYKADCLSPDLVIHIGNISGAHFQLRIKEVWRVNPDGEIHDTFRKLSNVFEMEEKYFFKYYSEIDINEQTANTYIEEWNNELNKLNSKIPDLPFSNAWIAYNISKKLPSNSVLHLGILNSLRCWNFFETNSDILGFANTGGFGIDGCVSSLLGASLADKNKLYFGIIGDLAFFYDMNAIGNRHVQPNLRIMLINNGIGTEFRLYGHLANTFGDKANDFMAASGHNGYKSRFLVKHLAEDLNFMYLSASNKEEFLNNIERFICPGITDKPILFEVFINSEDESEAVRLIYNAETSLKDITVKSAKNAVRSVLGDKGIQVLKKIIKG